MSKIPFKTCPYERRFNREDFCCGKDPLDNYILRNATNDVAAGTCTCFVIVNHADVVLAYHTLSTQSIRKEKAPAEYLKSIKYENIPVILLGSLAVDRTIQGQGYGKFLLIEALKKSVKVAKEHIGAVAVIVDPIDENAVDYYAKYGFTMLPDSGRMFMSIKKIEEALQLSKNLKWKRQLLYKLP